MPFDTFAPSLARNPAIRPAIRPGNRPVALWLFIICGMILVMVSLGGATRLTGSGLSIMEWAPLMGTLPPLSDAEWNRLYGLYQQIPQYDLLNHGFGLDGFKGIFWLEWTHRLWGRLLGVAFLGPLLWFAVRRSIDGRLARRLVLFLVLGGLQGFVGWFMVASGFAADSTAVSAYRLVAHLGLALLLYAAILWTALGLWGAVPQDRAVPGLRVSSTAVCGMVALTILAGGFVAGLRAGLTYNTFPLMDGQWIPEGYGALRPLVRNLTENVAAVQFDHRLLATMTAVAALLTVAWGLTHGAGPALRHALVVLGGIILIQYGLGVVTLIYAVPAALGTAHQAVAVFVLTAALVALHRQTRTLHQPGVC